MAERHMKLGPHFCPRCHRRIEIPKWLRDGKAKISGRVVINCGNCGSGKVTVNG